MAARRTLHRRVAARARLPEAGESCRAAGNDSTVGRARVAAAAEEAAAEGGRRWGQSVWSWAREPLRLRQRRATGTRRTPRTRSGRSAVICTPRGTKCQCRWRRRYRVSTVLCRLAERMPEVAAACGSGSTACTACARRFLSPPSGSDRSRPRMGRAFVKSPAAVKSANWLTGRTKASTESRARAAASPAGVPTRAASVHNKTAASSSGRMHERLVYEYATRHVRCEASGARRTARLMIRTRHVGILPDTQDGAAPRKDRPARIPRSVGEYNQGCVHHARVQCEPRGHVSPRV